MGKGNKGKYFNAKFSGLASGNTFSSNKLFWATGNAPDQVYDRDGTFVDTFMAQRKVILPPKCNQMRQVNRETIDMKMPLLVLCMVRERLISSIDYAMEMIVDKTASNVVKIVVHSKEEHCLPKIEAQEHVGDKYKNVIELAYTEQRGFYKCDYNKTGVRKLKKCLKNIRSGYGSSA